MTHRVQIPVLGGRAGVFQQAKTFQVFGTADTFQLEEPISPMGWEHGYFPQTGEQTPRRHKCERLFRVGTHAQVAWRDSEDPVEPLSIGDFESLYPRGSLAGATRGGAGWLTVLVKAATALGNYSFFMDVGEQVEIYAYSVSAVLVGPADLVQITSRNSAQSDNPVTLSGDAILDALVGGRIEPIECATGLRETKYTQVFTVAAGSQAWVPVPPFAREIRVIQSNVGSTLTWERRIGESLPDNIGVLNFTNRHSAESERMIGREGAFLTDIDALQERSYQVEWTVRP
jgi:hypothetical protein